jgi:hypothetical protein
MKTISEIIREQLTRTKNDIIANHIAAGQLDSGRTSGLFEVANVSMSGGQLLGWQWYQVWETGRRPGKWPPRRAIIDWLQTKKGIGYESYGASYSSEYKRLESIAFLIQRKIGNEGSSLFRQGGRKDIFTPPFERLAENLPEELGNLLIETIIEKK